MQWELRRLANGAAEDQQGDHGGGRTGERTRLNAEEHGVNVERTEDHHETHQAEGEADVANAVRNEGLLGGQAWCGLGVPEADQQIGGEADELPGGEDDEKVVGENEQEHREHEEVQVGEEAPVAVVVAHVADAVEVHQGANRGHH